MRELAMILNVLRDLGNTGLINYQVHLKMEHDIQRIPHGKWKSGHEQQIDTQFVSG